MTYEAKLASQDIFGLPDRLLLQPLISTADVNDVDAIVVGGTGGAGGAGGAADGGFGGPGGGGGAGGTADLTVQQQAADSSAQSATAQ